MADSDETRTDRPSTLRKALDAWGEASASGDGPLPYFQGGIDPRNPDEAQLLWGSDLQTKVTIDRVDDREVGYTSVTTRLGAEPVVLSHGSIEDFRRAMWEAVGERDPLLPPDDVPTIAELAEQLRNEYKDLTDWSVYENEAYAQVFEFKEHRRMQVWDEADFMGSIDGYSWQEQLWSGSEWVDVTEISTENGVPPLSVRELRAHLDAFRIEAEATRPESLTPREAALDRMGRAALGAAAGNAKTIVQLQGKLNKTAEDLRASERENEKIRTALIGLAQRITPPAPRQPAPENTGPVTGSPTASPGGPGL